MKHILSTRKPQFSLKRFNGLKEQHTFNQGKCVFHLVTYNQLQPAVHSWSCLHSNSTQARTIWNHVPLCSPTFISNMGGEQKIRDRGQQFLFQQTIHDVKTPNHIQTQAYIFIHLHTVHLHYCQGSVYFNMRTVEKEVKRWLFVGNEKHVHSLSQRKHLQHWLQTASSERAMHLLFSKKGQCIYYTMSICVSILNTLCSLHLLYWMISLQTETQLALNTFSK